MPQSATAEMVPLIESLGAIVWEMEEATGALRSLSPRFERLLGHPVARCLEDPAAWAAIVHADDRARVELGRRAAAASDDPCDIEYRAVAADGRILHLRDVARGGQDPDTGQRILYAITVDISAAGGVEAQPGRSVDHYRAVIEGVPQVIFQTDVTGRWTFLNAAWAEMTGFTVEETLGQSFLEYVHPDDRDRHLELLQPLIDRETDYLGREVRYLTRLGNVRWVEVLAQPMVSGGRIVGTSGSLTDVTERKRAEEELVSTRARLRQLLVSSPVVLYSRHLSQGFPLTFVSDNVARQFGHHVHDFVEDPEFWAAQIHPDDAGEAVAGLERLLEQGTQSHQYRLRRADGSYRWIHDERTLVRDAGGEPAEIVGSWLDITARKKAEDIKSRLEAELRQAQKMEAIGRLAGGVAHDFNNLLTVITGRADLVRFRLREDAATARDLEIVTDAARRASALTRQLLAFSRKQVVAPAVLDLSEVVSGMDKMLERLIGEDIELVTVAGPEPCFVRADPGEIEQVIMNLAVNARDAMPDGGRLTVETATVDVAAGPRGARQVPRPGSYVMLGVSDTGCGMDHATLERAFEPFFTTKPVDKGTGIGLSTVYGIVKQAGGEIEVESTVGRGTTFRLYLPRVTERRSIIETKDGPTMALLGSETVLLVEDEHALRDIAVEMLRLRGYTVLPAGNGEEALRVAERHDGPIHLLMTDVVMPGMGGRALAERVTSLRPETQVLYVSGYTDDAVLRQGILTDRTHFLQKPFTAVAVARKIREVLDRTRDGDAG